MRYLQSMEAASESPSAPAELTVRSLTTGIVLGALLTPCNVYSGLKIGWSFNMSVTALLLGYLLWRVLITGQRRWDILESNISQTSASSAASIISGGLVAPIPALALVSGITLAPLPLIAWVFAVSFYGVWVAWYLRTPLLYRSGLAYPAGAVAAETMRELFSQGEKALQRVRLLLSAAVLSAAVKLLDALVWTIPRFSVSGQAAKLTFVFDPSLLLVGFGAIIGLRAGLSLLLGALVAWGLLGPLLINHGIVAVDADAPSHFLPLVEWLLWPGVALMVVSALSSLAAGLYQRRRRKVSIQAAEADGYRAVRLTALLAAGALVVTLQITVMGIGWLPALLSLPMAFFLAAVVGRVVGETGIPPIGATGKLSQLSFALIAPGQATTNLMTANVAGGAAGQCADLLNDFKAGAEVGASPQKQVIAQCLGIATGSIVGSLVYLALIPDPNGMLLTQEWPAPAVATWAAVAEVYTQGLDQLPPYAMAALVVGGLLGLVLGVADMLCDESIQRWLPRASAMGLAFVIPASTSLGMFYGAALAWLICRRYPLLAGAFLMVAAAGLVAGESLMGVALAFVAMAGL